jgi:hypothetical protein
MAEMMDAWSQKENDTVYADKVQTMVVMRGMR